MITAVLGGGQLARMLALAGAPLAYWSGAEGQNPMRLLGGLMGGSWLASLAGDLGNDKFDGAWLVQNFEQLNPANTYWSKLYNVYANVDAEAERFLEFERWWGGFFVLNAEEMESIANEDIIMYEDVHDGRLYRVDEDG